MKVKEIYFEKGNDAPTYILDNGEIRRPYFTMGSLFWVTDEQFKVAIQKQADERKFDAQQEKAYNRRARTIIAIILIIAGIGISALYAAV